MDEQIRKDEVVSEDVSANADINPVNTPSEADTSKYSKFIVGIVLIVVLFLIIAGILAVTSHDTFNALVQGFWLFLFCTVLTFLLMGVLIMIGLKNQVKQILDIFVEGTLSIVDLMNFVRIVVKFVGDLIKQVISFIIPIFAYLIAAAIYFGLLCLYKWVGKTYDVTLLTIVLAAVLTILVGLLNKKSNEEDEKTTWIKNLQLKFKDSFSDATEIVLFVFFITMDSTKLFFLPMNLGAVSLHAKVDNYDLMTRGWTVDNALQTTLTLVMIAVSIEILRFAIKIIAAGYSYFKEISRHVKETNQNLGSAELIKWALRQSFESHKDEAIKFITYMTFLIFVFLAFPRLKLLAMVVASVSSLMLDFVVKDRLEIKKGHDLFSKIVSGVFGV